MAKPTIARVNGYEPHGYTYYPVLIVGAGESGIAMGCRLKEVLGFDQFRIFERQAGIGGTWWANRYPGVACDIPAIFYSYSFAPNPRWTTFHPSGAEIVQYLGDVCRQYQIVDKVQLDTEVGEARWLEDEEVWEVKLTYLRPGTGDLSDKDLRQLVEDLGAENVFLRQETVRAKVLVSAVGGLVEPNKWPENVPGKEDFEGDIFHTARWKADADFTDKDVIVVGTGCSSAQMVPRLTKAPYNAKSVTQLMRSPPWVVPQMQPPFGKELWEKYSPAVLGAVPALAATLRAMIFAGAEYDLRLFGGGEYNARERAKLEASLLKHMKASVPEKYHEILTPDYGVCCKRRIFDATWFPGLNNPKIELTTLPLTSIQPRGVTLGPGRTYPPAKSVSSVPTDEVQLPADTIILANGFEVGDWVTPLKIRGKAGKLLQDVWEERGGAQAYLGTAMDGFPNMFLIFGPNTATGHSSVILASENMVNYSLKFIKPILSGEVSSFEVKREAEVAYTRDIQEKLKDMVWQKGGCKSWYRKDNGWNPTVFPYSQIWFTLLCMFPRWRDWDIAYTRKGSMKMRNVQALRIVAFVIAIVGLSRARKAGLGLTNAPQFLRMGIKQALSSVLETGVRGLESVRGRLQAP
ncbi:MAG: hypothetical protein M1832_004858 [Thelocarpon impressellum]|nr:MAG: hypothetical protein M1832_004858 [Thelocarpon impressellum]